MQHPAFWLRRDGAWHWRGLLAPRPLPLAVPVYVSYAEASAYARWKRKRLPTEAEYHRAAYGTPDGGERRYPWGDEPPDPSRGLFDLRAFDPVAVGSFPAGASAFNSGDIPAGRVFAQTFTVPGTYKYFCTHHEGDGMVGTIVVAPAS